MNDSLTKSAKIVLKQSQFLLSKVDGNFLLRNINLGDHLKKNLTSIFEPLDSLKSCPIFDKLALPVISMVSFENIYFWPKILPFLDPPFLKLHNRSDIKV